MKLRFLPLHNTTVGRPTKYQQIYDALKNITLNVQLEILLESYEEMEVVRNSIRTRVNKEGFSISVYDHTTLLISKK